MEFILSKIMHRPKKEKEDDGQQTCSNQSMSSEIEKNQQSNVAFSLDSSDKSTPNSAQKKEQQVLVYDENSLENHQRILLNVNAPTFVPSSRSNISLNSERGSNPNGNSTFLALPETITGVYSDDEESFAECHSFVEAEGEQFYSQGNSAVNSSENLLRLNETEVFADQAQDSHITVSSSTFNADWNVSEIVKELPKDISTNENLTKINDTDNISIPPDTTLSLTGKLNRSFAVDSSEFTVPDEVNTSVHQLSTEETHSLEPVLADQVDVLSEEKQDEPNDDIVPKIVVDQGNDTFEPEQPLTVLNVDSVESFFSADESRISSSPPINDQTLIVDKSVNQLDAISVEVGNEEPNDTSLPYFNASSVTPNLNSSDRCTSTTLQVDLPELGYNSFKDLQTSIELDKSINHNDIIDAKMPELFSSPSDNNINEHNTSVGFQKDMSPVSTINCVEMMDVDETICENGTQNRVSCSPSKLSGSPVDNQLVVENNFVRETFDVTFKMPSLPVVGACNKRRSDDGSIIGSSSSTSLSDEDFRPVSNGFQFSDSDFDFLSTKGCSNPEDIRRDSVLSTFDPLLKKLVPVSATTAKRLSGNQLAFSNNQARNIEKINEEVLESDTKNFKFNASGDFELAPTVKGEPNNSSSSIVSQEEYATMSIGVMTDMLIENNINENQNFQKMSEQNAELEKKIQNEVTKTEDIEKKLKDAEQREEALLKRISEKDRNITKMTGIVEAYEKAIAELISEKEQIVQNYEKKCVELQADSDSNAQHLASLETTFSDVHIKYEKTKKLAKELADKVDQLLQEKQENLDNLHMQEQRYEKMKSHAMAQLDIANNKLADMTKIHHGDITKLKALLKKEEISRASTQEQLQQKSRENSELMKICDELINGGQTS